MIFRNRAPLAAAVAALLALSACESATDSNAEPQGTLSFTFTGDAAGSYDASGRFDRQRPGVGTFAVGSRARLQGTQEALLVVSHVPRPGTSSLADEFLLSLESPAVGTVTCTAEEEACSFGALFFVGAARSGAAQETYSSVSGTITITSLDDDRARGTFSFRMEGFAADQEPQTIQVTSGAFDVPLIEGVG
jgi:hypothetical protein